MSIVLFIINWDSIVVGDGKPADDENSFMISVIYSIHIQLYPVLQSQLLH